MTDMPRHGGDRLHRRAYETNARGPLSGVRVLDLSRLFAGNVLTQIMADFGADVVKVEPPAGDTLRAWKTKDVSLHWKIYARSKRSLCLDLKTEGSKALLLEMAKGAAIFIESFRPGVLEAMGLGPDVLLAANPKLVIVRISGWGQGGPYRRKPGFGTVIEGMSGFAAMNGFADREPVLPPTYLADGVAGLYGASAVMIALREAEREGGNGQVIDLPLYDPLFAILGPSAAQYRLTGQVKPRTGSRSNNSAPRNAYQCKDGGYVGLSGSTQSMAERIFQVIGRPDLITDPRFRTNADRLRNVAVLDGVIAEFFGRYTQAEAVDLMDKAEVTVGPIYDIRQIMDDPHVIEREILADYDDEDVGALPMHHVTPRLSDTPGTIRAPAPRLGEHNDAVLADFGVGEDRRAALSAAGVVIGTKA
jgi:crotonobetainyl-CoA:carnitine CoA-transferase CaiB-like acyl-CoA transferase